MSQSPDYAAKPVRKRTSPLTWVLGLSALFFAIFLIVSGALFLTKSPGGARKAGGALFAGGSVGVIELKGVIMDSRKILKQLDKFEEEDDIKSVVLHLNSPGGAVAPSQEIYQAVRKFKKPLVVSMASMAASGAFYVACGAKKVYANPGTITGSIGVIMEFASLEKLYDWAKIRRYAIKTGKFKDAGAEYREMTDEEKALLQTMVDDVLVQFKEAISKGRGLTPEQVTAIADGRIFSGSQAKAIKLVDELGGLPDAIDDAAKQAKLTGKPHVVYAEDSKRKWLDLLLDGQSEEESSEAQVAPIGVKGLVQGLIGHSLQESVTGLTPGIYWIWNGNG